MRGLAWLVPLVLAFGSDCLPLSSHQPPQAGEELQITDHEIGHYGGTLVVAQTTEPKTLNPVTAADVRSREVTGRMMADLIHINRDSQKTEPSLAKSWVESRDGRVFTLKLRHGLRFSDGQPFNADDVVFSFQVYLDEKIHSPQRDLLIVGGKPIAVQKVDAYTVRFTLAQPYAAAERIFGFAASDAVGRDLNLIIPEGLREHFARSLEYARSLRPKGAKKGLKTWSRQSGSN